MLKGAKSAEGAESVKGAEGVEGAQGWASKADEAQRNPIDKLAKAPI